MSPSEAVTFNGNSHSNGSTAPAVQRTAISSATNGERHGNGISNGQTQADQPKFRGHDREEVTRILMQSLHELGYSEAAENLSKESGLLLESPMVASLRSAVLSGSWSDVEGLLLDAAVEGQSAPEGTLKLAAGTDVTRLQLSVRQQKFLELLESGDSSSALMVLRSEITPNCKDQASIRFLAGLVMWRSPDELKTAANWDGAAGGSRKRLLSELCKSISPSALLPDNRLATMLDHVKDHQIKDCLYHTKQMSPSLYSDHICDHQDFPSVKVLTLRNFRDNDPDAEVWQIAFSHDGKKLAACGNANYVVIWNTNDFSTHVHLTGHGDTIGNLSWSPDDSMLVTCSVDKHVRLWDSETGNLLKTSHRYGEPISGCVWASDNQSFIIGSLANGAGITTINVHDDAVLDWEVEHRVQDICGSRDGAYIVAMDHEKSIYVYDAPTRNFLYQMSFQSRPSSVNICHDSRFLLVNKIDGEAQLIDLVGKTVVRRFIGYVGGKDLIRACFGGANESFVSCGSEDGNIFIWHKHSGAVVERLRAHLPKVNAIAWNPADPCMFATCGDDGVVSIWTNKARSRGLEERASDSWGLSQPST